jgi:hypothetical protein
MYDDDLKISYTLEYCPFCGETKNLAVQLARPKFMLKAYQNRYVFAGCRSCGATTQLFAANNKTGSPTLNAANLRRAIEEAAKAWNRRTNTEPVTLFNNGGRR